MTEPDVALTDYVLAAESFLIVWLLLRRGITGHLQFWFIVFFVSAGVASVCGGTVHGFFADEQNAGHAMLWRATLLAVGVATLANWAIGARLLFADHISKWVTVAAGVQLAAYCVVVIFVSQDFRVAIADNLPAVLFLILALLFAHRREPRVGLFQAAGGLSLTLVAAAAQQFRVAIHPVYFNHNALFHVVQAVAILLFFLGCRSLIKTDINDRSGVPGDGQSGASQISNSIPAIAIQGDSNANSP